MQANTLQTRALEGNTRECIEMLEHVNLTDVDGRGAIAAALEMNHVATARVLASKGILTLQTARDELERCLMYEMNDVVSFLIRENTLVCAAAAAYPLSEAKRYTRDHTLLHELRLASRQRTRKRRIFC